MGCFSFKCIECGRGIRSTSFSGEHTHLFLLKDSEVIQQMTGEYDSYGRVFIDNTQREDVKHELRQSQNWNIKWGSVCELLHNKDIKNGIAAVHVNCFKEVPTIRSVDDPNQGWGEEYEFLEDVESEVYPYMEPIPGYNVLTDHVISKLNYKIKELDLEIDYLKKINDACSAVVLESLEKDKSFLESKLTKLNSDLSKDERKTEILLSIVDIWESLREY